MMRGLRRPAVGRVGSTSDGRPSPLPKNRLEARVEAQKSTIAQLEADKAKLKNTIKNLVGVIEKDVLERLPKKLAADIRSVLEEASDELD